MKIPNFNMREALEFGISFFWNLNSKVDLFKEGIFITFTNRNSFIANQNLIFLNRFYMFYIDDIRPVNSRKTFAGK